MNASAFIVVLIIVVLGGLIGVIAVKVARESNRSKSRNSNLRQIGRYESAEEDEEAQELSEQEDAAEAEAKKKKSKKRKEPTVDELLFMAGRLSQAEREAFHKRRKLAPIIFGGVGLVIGLLNGPSSTTLLVALVGVLAGLYLPMKILRGWVKQQHEELSYYLPLLIEQISIGVSSSLDIGPCLAQLVQMADERNSHNPTTDLIKHALFYVKSGVGLDQALVEIGRASGQAEFKQALLALSQVTKFGGEVSKQLQELADAVSSQREAKIEGEIRKLELKATGPVSLVFLAFVLLLGLGIAAQVLVGMEG
jgi:Flp pilus assembly protein TadB